MKVDIKEEDGAYILEAEIPGVKRENIAIDIDQDRLTIAVDANDQQEDGNVRYLRRERRVGTMRRSFDIQRIDRQKISAKYEDGLLVLRLPKIEKAGPASRKINIE